jgi:CRP-like cAMP-binding protein
VPLLLSKVPLLTHLSATDKERIHDMLQLQDFAAEATIISQGDIEHDSTSFMYFMESGEAIATVDGILSTRYIRGTYFGELALLNRAPRKATIRAGLSGARCLKLSRSDFRKLEFNEAMLQAQQDLYNSITDKLSVKRKTKTSTQQKLDDQHRSLADRHFGTLRGMGAGMLKLLGSDAPTDGGARGGLRSLSDVVGAGKAGLNTPVFVAALTQNKHGDDSILKVRGRVIAAINAGKKSVHRSIGRCGTVACVWIECQTQPA